MGRLTTHVLDTSTGSPAGGIAIRLYRLAGDARALVTEAVTNADGRCDRPVLEGTAFTAGDYELVFHAGPYFDGRGLKLPQPKFLDQVVIRFGVALPEQHYHVPLLLSPYSYATYRGS